MSEYQEEVLTNLLDLQAELRGDEPGERDDGPQASPQVSVDAEPGGGHETVAVTEEGLTVSVSPAASPVPASVGVSERLAALNERLAKLEYDLAGVTKRVERIEPDPEMDPSATTDADIDARWRSFLDLQKIVADRLDHR
jgi:hypothetical protein